MQIAENEKPAIKNKSKDERDTSLVVYFHSAIFNIRCSISDQNISSETLNHIQLSNLLFNNPGSYPTIMNEIDVPSQLHD